MSFFEKLLHNKTYFGVDIGTTSIKIVELKQGGQKPGLKDYCVLESYAHLEKFNAAIQTSNLKMLDQKTAEYLKTAIQQIESKDIEAIASVPTFSAFTTLIEMPAMSEADTSKAMAFQVRQYVPLPISEVTTDWIKIMEKKDSAGNLIQQVLLISIPNEIINKYKNVFQLAGVKLIALEVEGLSLARALTLGSPEVSLIVDIGSRSTSILIAQNGFLKFVSQTDFAGSSLTQNLAAGTSLSPQEAEEMKRQRGIVSGELSTLLIPVLDAIINETRLVKEDFEKNYKEPVQKLILTGGGANLSGIEKYFGEQLGLPAVKGNPLSRVDYPEELNPLLGELNNTLAIAAGLALRDVH
ncbi:MAG: type IV pilus assembly protein PilM [bacterium]|nr:type IV pilus assembly protein PilM [bacterium]